MRSGTGRKAVLLTGATLLAALTALSGCARVDLVNEWPAMGAPTGWEPKPGACSLAFAETSYRSAYETEDCSKRHLYETVHIGQFKGDAASAATPPAAGSTAMLAAWAECDTKTTEFLGGEWRGGRISVELSLPSSGNWEGGARWFRCEVSALTKDFTGHDNLSKSLKGEFAGESVLKYGCYQRSEGNPLVDKACNEAHNSEYVGVFTSTDTWDEVNKNLPAVHQKCRSLVAAYAGVPDDGNLKYRTGTWYFVADKREWDAGDHGVRCHMWMGSKTFTSSIKGGGTKILPINYA